jgi:hypothetical protein
LIPALVAKITRTRSPRTKNAVTGWGFMEMPKPGSECSCARLSHRIAFHLMLDEFAIAALSEAVADLRDANDPGVPELEHAVRTQRIGIVKQRAILGAAGLEV